MNKQISSFSRNDSKTLSHLELILNEDFQIALNVSFDNWEISPASPVLARAYSITWRVQTNRGREKVFDGLYVGYVVFAHYDTKKLRSGIF